MRAASVVSIILGALGLLGSCRGGTAGPDPRASGCSTNDPAASSSAPVSASATAPVAPPPHVPFAIERTCSSDIDTSAQPSVQLDELASRCAPGMTPHAANERLREPITANESKIEVALASDACVRVGAVAEARDAVVELWLEADEGARIAHVEPSRGPVMLGPQGPVCVRVGGTYRVGIHAWGREPKVHVRVWEGAPPPTASASSSR